MIASKIKLKLLVDIKAKKVVFVEAGKDFIDFLVHLLLLPLITVVRLLKEKNMMEPLGSLYLFEIFQFLPDAYFQQNQFKSSLLYPRLPIDSSGIPLKLSGIGSYPMSYFCLTNHPYVARVPNLLCPSCRQKMTRQLTYVSPSPMNTEVPDGGGFVKGLVPYIVTDNLEFMSVH
ncbi:hypothetical protein Ddye_018991 [Dipteronia dyeriana]|uniref:Uncharacterized protein n=1 Tax=Dipteronia dyeriana TaxID=168575 RepID=A0AAD9TX48_9ROSI|nr:hypothetical protein Ddye_018991 [Dipteronia dyeriana]